MESKQLHQEFDQNFQNLLLQQLLEINKLQENLSVEFQKQKEI